MKINKYIALICGLCCFAACNNDIPITEVGKKVDNPYKENMITASNYVAKSEENEIDSYIKRKKWDTKMKRFDNGMRVWEYETLSDKKIDYEDEVVIQYSVQSITEKDIYTNLTDTIVVGKHEPNVGIDKALQELHYGSSAKVILPSHLAYGFVGDADRIGTNMILIYDIKIEQK